MSADLLRQAAAILRERAQSATHGPWFVDEFDDGSVWLQEADGQVQQISARSTAGDAAYIATMHPGVGLALADWLDAEAERQSGPFAHPFGPDEHAIAVASVIVGGDA